LENDLRLPEVTKDISTILSHSLLIVPRELTKSFVAYKPNEFDLDMEITGLSKSKTRTKSERFIITGASGIQGSFSPNNSVSSRKSKDTLFGWLKPQPSNDQTPTLQKRSPALQRANSPAKISSPQMTKSRIAKPRSKFIKAEPLKTTGNVNPMVLAQVSSFQSNVAPRLTADQFGQFGVLCNKLVWYIEANESMFKGVRGGSIADAMLLLVGSKIGLDKKDFLENIRTNKRWTASRLNDIKKYLCYKNLKKGFMEILKGS
jgi:hypothetical protein